MDKNERDKIISEISKSILFLKDLRFALMIDKVEEVEFYCKIEQINSGFNIDIKSKSSGINLPKVVFKDVKPKTVNENNSLVKQQGGDL